MHSIVRQTGVAFLIYHFLWRSSFLFPSHSALFFAQQSVSCARILIQKCAIFEILNRQLIVNYDTTTKTLGCMFSYFIFSVFFVPFRSLCFGLIDQQVFGARPSANVTWYNNTTPLQLNGPHSDRFTIDEKSVRYLI